MSPTRYVLLRRSKEVRRVLRDADPDMVNVVDVAHRFGFAQLGRFARKYRMTFGESPSGHSLPTPGMRLASP
jgi:AraC-like DNA-binding protein